MHLPLLMLSQWNLIKARLCRFGILQSDTKDILVWGLKRSNQSTNVKSIYADLISVTEGSSQSQFPTCFWKAACPLKMILFSWLLFWNKNITWEVLQRKSWQGLSRCSLCLNDGESSLHVFFQCASSLKIWYDLSLQFGFPHIIFSSVQDAFFWWSKQSSTWRSLFIISCWFLWIWRNDHIFHGSGIPLHAILQRILACHESFYQDV